MAPSSFPLSSSEPNSKSTTLLPSITDHNSTYRLVAAGMSLLNARFSR
jgi:hypothetical protein